MTVRDENRAALLSVKQKIEALEDELKKSEELLEKAIAEGKPEYVLTSINTLLKSAAAELQRLGQEKSVLLKIQAVLVGDKGIKSIPFTEAQAMDIAEVTGINVYHKPYTIPLLDERVVPSEDFLKQLEKNNKVWSLNSEASRRTVIDLFLRDVIVRDEFDKMRIFCELNMSVVDENRTKKLNGDVDYTIGYAGDMPIDQYFPPEDSHLIVFEAKKDWPNDSHWQCIAQAATLYKTRKDQNKRNPRVWGILSNANNWKFIHINNDGQLFVSGKYFSGIPTMCTEDQISTIYRIIHHIVKQAYESSPTTTPVQSALNSQESLTMDED
jgi:hypothetical protein